MMRDLKDLGRILKNIRDDNGDEKLYYSLFVIFHADSIKVLDKKDRQELVSAIGWGKGSTSELSLFCKLGEYVELSDKARSIVERADR